MQIFPQKLLYIVKIVNCKNLDLQIKLGAPSGVQSSTLKSVGEMFKNLPLNSEFVLGRS